MHFEPLPNTTKQVGYPLLFCLQIALKECSETEYWLEIFFQTNKINETTYKSLKNDAGTIRRILIKSCKTVKENK